MNPLVLYRDFHFGLPRRGQYTPAIDPASRSYPRMVKIFMWRGSSLAVRQAAVGEPPGRLLWRLCRRKQEDITFPLVIALAWLRSLLATLPGGAAIGILYSNLRPGNFETPCWRLVLGRFTATQSRKAGVSTVMTEERAPDIRRPSYE